MPKKSKSSRVAAKAPAREKRTALRRSNGTASAKVAREKASRLRKAADVAISENRRGKYVYCVIQSADSLKFGAAGIGDNGSEIHTFHYRDLAAVVSDVPLGILDSTREN